MRSILRDRAISIPLLLGASAIVPAGLIHFFGRTEVEIAPAVHFAPIAVAAAIAAFAATALTLAGARRGDGRAVLVGTAFSAMAALLCVHGLTTPGLLADVNGVVSFTGAATLPVGAAVLSLAALPGIRGPRYVPALLRLEVVLVVAIVVLGVLGLAEPQLVPAVPQAGSPGALVLLALGTAFFAPLAIRAARTFLLTRRGADLAVTVGIVLLAVSLWPALLLTYVDLGFWFGHAMELIGIAMVGIPVALDLYRGAESRPLSGDLEGAALVRDADQFLGPSVRALLVRLREKDAYTETHTRGVALRSVQVGERLGLPPKRLRELAIGALVHDVGKLSVPDAVLQKPAALTGEEFELIKQHPEAGVALLHEFDGFSELVVGLVRDHHERLDGSGYPRGLSGSDLNLETRVLAVCDVYDALISHRVYREAWTPGAAMGLLRRDAGTQFDPICVNALEAILLADGTLTSALAEASVAPRPALA